MAKDEPPAVHAAPAASPPTEERRRAEEQMREMRDWIMARLASFALEFESLAETPRQGVRAERFKVAVQCVAKDGPVTAADLSPGSLDFPDWLKGHADRFEEIATTPAQKELAGSLREFAREVGSPAVKEIFQRPLVNELVEDIKAWMGGKSNGVPFDQLSPEGKRELLSMGVDWTDYINRGLDVGTKETWRGIDAIIDNAIAGKPADQWMAGVTSHPQRLAEAAKRPAPAPDKERGPDR